MANGYVTVVEMCNHESYMSCYIFDDIYQKNWIVLPALYIARTDFNNSHRMPKVYVGPNSPSIPGVAVIFREVSASVEITAVITRPLEVLRFKKSYHLQSGITGVLKTYYIR
jgi:hypothetical protein